MSTLTLIIYLVQQLSHMAQEDDKSKRQAIYETACEVADKWIEKNNPEAHM